MVSKTITVKEKAYNVTKASKRPDESFSDLLIRTFEPKKPDYFSIVGLWGEKKGESVRKIIQKSRRENLRLSNARTKRLGL